MICPCTSHHGGRANDHHGAEGSHGVHGGVLVVMEGGDPHVCECEFDEMPTRRWESGALVG